MIDIYKNALFGDGCISKNKNGNHCLSFSSTNKSLIELKSRILNSKVRESNQHKDAWGTKKLYTTCKTVLPQSQNKEFHIQSLSLEDFFLWLLDDGSYHKTKGFMNLNSHSLTRSENIELSFHLWHSLGIETRVLPEKKRDGRLFWYLYIPGAQVDSFKPELRLFMKTHSIYGMEYKIGEPSTAIEITAA